MNVPAVVAVAGWELRLAVRGRLVMGTALTFTVVCVLATLLGLRSVSSLGLAGVGPGTGALINLAILFPPLMGITLGANSLSSARERSLLPLMLVQPLSRLDHVCGVVLGLVGAVWLTIGFGFGASALLLARVAGTSDVSGLLAIVGSALGVGVVSVAIGVAISALAGSRLQALGVSMGLWFLFAFAIDLVRCGRGRRRSSGAARTVRRRPAQPTGGGTHPDGSGVGSRRADPGSVRRLPEQHRRDRRRRDGGLRLPGDVDGVVVARGMGGDSASRAVSRVLDREVNRE